MNPELDPHQIVRALAHHSLDEQTLTTLAQARARALRAKPSPVGIKVFAGHLFTLPHRPHIERQWLIVGVLVVALLLGVEAWQDDQDQQNCDIEVAILTDELPLEVFVD
ncbi:MAG: DUF3619 family protein [Gallionella sp.]